MGGYPWWLLVLAGTGALALGAAFVTLFFALGRRPGRMWTDEIGPVGSADFLRPLAALLNVPIRHGGRAELLHNGDGFMPRLLQDIAAAQYSINLMVYIWEPGRMHERIMAALEERASAGVQVRVLLDGFGALKCPGEDIERLRQAGGRVDHFRAARLGKLTRFHRRNHRRAIVLDGRVAYTGGMAIGDQWLGNARNPEEWRDTMTRVVGPMVRNLQSAFGELWAFCTGEVLTGDPFFPPDLERDAPDSTALSAGIISSPSSEDHPLRVFFFLTFLAARERLWITTPYLVPDRQIRAVLKNRARAGTDVRVLVPGEHSDAWPIRRASHSYYRELLAAGVRIYEYAPTMIHTKHVVVDGLWSVIGSANMDIRSKELNKENVLGVLDADFAGELEQCFLADLESAVEIEPRTWARRGLGRRLLERGSVLFAEQY